MSKLITTDVEQFARDRGAAFGNEPVTAPELYDEFCSWCEERGKEPMALPTFGREFGDLGVQKVKLDGRVRYVGVAAFVATPGRIRSPRSVISFSDKPSHKFDERATPLDASTVSRLDRWIKSLPSNWAASRRYAREAFLEWCDAAPAWSGPFPDEWRFERYLERRLKPITLDGKPCFWKRPWFRALGSPPANLRRAELDDAEWMELCGD
jgi:hypothetical protein